jgi:hypothetical protein
MPKIYFRRTSFFRAYSHPGQASRYGLFPTNYGKVYRNLYDRRCRRCAAAVAAGEGVAVKAVDGWVGYCDGCAASMGLAVAATAPRTDRGA